MKKINYLLSAMGLLALAACSSDSDEEYGRDLSTARQIVPVTQISENVSRASQGLQSTSIASDVKVRFLVTEANSTTISNQSLLTSNGSNSFSESETKLYYPVSGSADIYGYAPATSTTVSDLTADQEFEIQTDQSTDANYLASDLLIATKTTATTPTDENSYVVVTFKHALTKINLNIEESLKPATVKINNIKTKCTFNLSTGAVTATGDAGSVTAASTATKSTRASETSYKYSAIIIPQNFSTDAAMLEITTTDGDTYTFTPSATVTAAGATEYTYNVTTTSAAKQVAMTLQSEVTNWESTDEQDAVVVEVPRTAHVGDWYTAEGKYVDGSTTAPENTIGIVFSTTVSDADKTAGYTCYVSALTDYGTKTKWSTDETTLSTQFGTSFVATTDVETALDGRTLTEKISSNENYLAVSKALAATDYVTGGTYAAPSTSSGWFVPSVGQMNQLAALIYGGDATTTETAISYAGGYSGKDFATKVKAAKSDSNFLSSGDPTYWTVSEVDASNIWVAILYETKACSIKQNSKTTNNGCRIHLILAAK